MDLSFPELALRPSCMRGHRSNAWGFQASPGIRPVGAHLLTPMRVARAPQQDGGRLRMGRRCHGGAGTAAPRWSRPPQTKPSGAKPLSPPSHKKPVGREPFTAHWREGFPVYLPSFSPFCSELKPLFVPLFSWRPGGGVSPAWRTPGLGTAVGYYLAYEAS